MQLLWLRCYPKIGWFTKTNEKDFTYQIFLKIRAYAVIFAGSNCWKTRGELFCWKDLVSEQDSSVIYDRVKKVCVVLVQIIQFLKFLNSS